MGNASPYVNFLFIYYILMQPSLYLIQTPESIPDSDFFNLLALLPQERQDRIRKFVFRRSALHTLAGEMMIRIYFSRLLSVHPQSLIFTRDDYGKPHLLNHSSCFFNIAHSGHFAAVIFNSDTVGVDIEHMREIDLAIAKRFFSSKENDDLLKKEVTLQRDYFYNLWTLKESYIKAVGLGLSIPLNSFAFSFTDNNEIVFESFSEDKAQPFKFRQYRIASDYKCAACSLTDNFPDKITDIDFNKLCSDFVDIYK